MDTNEQALVQVEAAPLAAPSAAVAGLVAASIADNTKRTYAAALKRLDAALEGQDLTDASLAVYLASLHAAGLSPAVAAMAGRVRQVPLPAAGPRLARRAGNGPGTGWPATGRQGPGPGPGRRGALQRSRHRGRRRRKRQRVRRRPSRRRLAGGGKRWAVEGLRDCRARCGGRAGGSGRLRPAVGWRVENGSGRPGRRVVSRGTDRNQGQRLARGSRPPGRAAVSPRSKGRPRRRRSRAPAVSQRHPPNHPQPGGRCRHRGPGIRSQPPGWGARNRWPPAGPRLSRCRRRAAGSRRRCRATMHGASWLHGAPSLASATVADNPLRAGCVRRQLSEKQYPTSIIRKLPSTSASSSGAPGSWDAHAAWEAPAAPSSGRRLAMRSWKRIGS